MPCKDNTKEKRGTVLGKKFPSRYLCRLQVLGINLIMSDAILNT